MIGNDRVNNLYIVGCSATIDAGKGKDVIRHSNYDGDLEQGYVCTSGRTTLRGGSGNDTIQGGFRADRISTELERLISFIHEGLR